MRIAGAIELDFLCRSCWLSRRERLKLDSLWIMHVPKKPKKMVSRLFAFHWYLIGCVKLDRMYEALLRRPPSIRHKCSSAGLQLKRNIPRSY